MTSYGSLDIHDNTLEPARPVEGKRGKERARDILTQSSTYGEGTAMVAVMTEDELEGEAATTAEVGRGGSGSVSSSRVVGQGGRGSSSGA
ncbi:hypothetical protein QJS10_CPA08g00619 [Acorus calamus]|uniref:Uncharacterized protein n=1 Tax=Acorus calamus TaxID=4465 RepID=A0AAV9E8K6_ACOCL|nr:hypothetical protein QJS10_CPA08g00619 [Acorus calamus]